MFFAMTFKQRKQCTKKSDALPFLLGVGDSEIPYNVSWNINPPNSPETCGCSSCNGAEPSSVPQRRAPRPRLDKPS